MKKIFVIALALVMVLSSLAIASAEPLTLEFWTVFTGDDGTTLQKLVDQFNAEYDGKIKVNHTPLSDPYTNLGLAVNTGTDVPHIMIGHVERIPKMVDDGILTYMDFLYEGDVKAENYPASVLARTNYDGYQYGIPWDFNAPILYVNLDLLAKYGLEDILADKYVTFDEINKAGEAVKAAGDLGKISIINYYGNWNEFPARYEALAGKELFVDGNLVIDTEIWGQMMKAFQDWNTNGYAMPREDDHISRFVGNTLLFYEQGTWTNATLMKQEGLNYTAVMMPVFDAAKPLCRSGSHTWMQPEDEERTEEEDMAVATFVNWMGENSIIWGTEGGQVPLHKAASEDPAFAELEQAFLADAGTVDYVKIYRYDYWNAFTSACNDFCKDPMYDTSFDLNGIGTAIQKKVDDAIAAGL